MKFSTFTIARADTGAVLPYCRATVYLADGVTLASIFNAGGGSISNPVTADVNGAIAFATADATCVIKAISADGLYSVPNITVDIFDLNNIVATANAAATSSATSATSAQAAAAAIGICNAVLTAGGALPFTVTSISGGIGTGTGGTDGTYQGVVVGGPMGFRWSYTIAGGKLASYTIVSSGLSTSNAVPTLAFASGTGMTGATVPTATVAAVPVTSTYYGLSSDNNYLLLWQNVAGTQTAVPGVSGQVTLPVKGAIDAISALLGVSVNQGDYPGTLGSNTANVAASTYIRQIAVSQTGTITGFSVTAFAASAAQLCVLTKNGSNQFTIVGTPYPVTLAAGVNSFPTWNPAVTAGQYIGVYTATGVIRYDSGGEGFWYTSGVPTTNTASTASPGNLLHMGWQVSTALLAQSPLNTQAIATTNLLLSGAALTVGTYPAVAGTGNLSSGLTVFAQSQVAAAGQITGISVYAQSAGPATLVLCADNGDGTVTIQQSMSVTLATGANTFTAFKPVAAVGNWVGVYAVGGIGYTSGSTGNTLTYTSGLAGTSTAKATVAAALPQISFTMQSGEITRTGAAEANLQTQITGATTTQGLSSGTPGRSIAAGYTTFNNIPVSQTGQLTSVSVNANTAGSGQIVVATLSGGVITLVSATPITLIAGRASYSCETAVSAGQYIGIYGTNQCVGYDTSGGSGAFYCAGVPGASTASTSLGGAYKPYISWSVASGVLPRLAAVEALAATSGQSNSGLGLLSSADPTGVVDATTVFSTARTSHPHPNVPLATSNYSVTSLTNNGEGLWGEGPVINNGVVISLPKAPEIGSRWLKLRGALMSQIYSGAALIINGDSISNGSFGTSHKTSYIGLIARYANMGIALDDAVLVNFDNSDAGGLAFHGLSLSNPTTPTNGTNGPVGKSLMLAVGQVLTFTGSYERVDVTYQGVTGGALAFAYNGAAAYKTVTCASSGNDVSAAAGATGQTASGTYTITNTGTAPVEITSLMRLGVKVGGSPPRLYVCRFAHGGYAFSNYGAAQMASMVRIATAIAGGTNHFVIPALGTNDEVGSGLSYTALKANVTSYINAWVAAGIPVSSIMPTLPWRWSYYAGGGSYEQGLAAMMDAFAAAGIPKYFRTDGSNIVDHPDDTGHRLLFNTIVKGFAEK
jgi:hypothetical protein